MKRSVRCFLFLSILFVAISCRSENETLKFDITWPLVDTVKTNKPAHSLLNGLLTVRPEVTDKRAQLVINIKLTRPTKQVDRKYWNKTLVYLKYDWMSRLRVWDKERKWLYPNLSYLFKLHGKDRDERYGGWDKGHNNDNDFGAVLIRKYDKTGDNEGADTEERPLVSAGWYPVGVNKGDKHTVVHGTRSDDFTVHLSRGQAGRIKVWLIYADFMTHAVPKSWPKDPEYKGGILSFFYVDWSFVDDKLHLALTNEIPDANTDFDWEEWVARSEELDIKAGKPVLTDR